MVWTQGLRCGVWQWEFRDFSSLSNLVWSLSSQHKDLSSSYFYSFLNLPGAETRARNEIAEKEQELLQQKLQEQQQEMEAQQKSFQENIAQLTEKLEKERENLLRDEYDVGA